MDLSFLTDYINPIVLGVCLCIGFALNYAKIFERFGNQYIPLSMLVLGSVISLVINIGNISAEVILGGMISGLASTGLYEMVRNLLNKKNNETKEETR